MPGVKTEIGYARKMKWWNLRNNECPKCSKDFMKHGSITKDSVYCKCGFFISMEKYKQVVNSMNVKDVEQKLDEMEIERGEWV
ncbi:MAG TPA: hypothetical protein VIU13_14360 [Chryseolinea sp.]